MALINFAGIASGIDTSALIKATLEQTRRTRINPLENQNTQLSETNSVLSELKQKLNKLKEAVENFRAINGGPISRLASSSSESVLTGIASNAASNGTYNLNVTSLATNATSSFDDRFAAASDVINGAINDGAAAADRTVTITVGTGGNQETVSVELTSSTTVAQFVDQFNANSSQAQASLVNTGTETAPSYAIVISSNNEGTEQGQLGVTVGAEITAAGGGALTSSTLSQATNAQFSVDGIAGTFTRSSNTVNNVIEGVTIGLEGTGTATLSVTTDSEATKNATREFVEAYNEVLTFIEENDRITQVEEEGGTSNIFGALSSTQVDENVLFSIRSALTSARSESGTARILADLGVTTDRDGSLAFNEERFDDSLASDVQGVQTILTQIGEQLANPSTGSISIFTRFGGIVDDTVTSNQTQIDDNLRKINDLESQLEKDEQALIQRFARLEGSIGKLQAQQSSLASLLSGL